MSPPARIDGEAGRRFPQLKRMTPQVRDELLRILHQEDRPLCYECLRDYKDHPERLCTFQPGNSRCDSCSSKGVYCLKLLVGPSRPCFRTIQKFAREVTEHRIKNSDSVAPDVMEAYDTTLKAALSFADAVKEIKDLKEDRDRLAAANIQTLRRAAACKTPEDANNWAAQCGWELAQLSQHDVAAAKRGELAQGGQQQQTERPDPGNGLKRIFEELRDVKAKRWLLQDRKARMAQELEKARAEIEELKRSKTAAETARDTLAEELRNSEATILAAKSAIERSNLERSARLEQQPLAGSRSKSLTANNLAPLACTEGNHRPARALPVHRPSHGDTERKCSCSHEAALSRLKLEMATGNGRPTNIFHRLPLAVKNNLFRIIIEGIPSINNIMELELGADGKPVAPKTFGFIKHLSRLGKNFSYYDNHALLVYVSLNYIKMNLPGIRYQWTREDHAETLNLCLVSKEFMVRLIKAQASVYAHLASDSDTNSSNRKGKKRPAARPQHYPRPPASLVLPKSPVANDEDTDFEDSKLGIKRRRFA